MPYHLSLTAVTKTYTDYPLFEPIHFTVTTGQIVGISGRNGSGKTTLLKLIAGLLSVDSGEIVLRRNADHALLERVRHTALSGPYLTFYDELTGEENIRFAMSHLWVSSEAEALFSHFGLSHARTSPLKAYSSGMIQRLRLIQALLRTVPVLLLDEPTATLDALGRAQFNEALKSYSSDRIVLIASNDSEDLSLSHTVIPLIASPRTAVAARL